MFRISITYVIIPKRMKHLENLALPFSETCWGGALASRSSAGSARIVMRRRAPCMDFAVGPCRPKMQSARVFETKTKKREQRGRHLALGHGKNQKPLTERFPHPSNGVPLRHSPFELEGLTPGPAAYAIDVSLACEMLGMLSTGARTSLWVGHHQWEGVLVKKSAPSSQSINFLRPANNRGK